MIKPLVAFYIGGMGAYYHAMFCRYGFQETADRVRDLYTSGQRREATEAVSDELIDAIAICGPAAHCREQLQEWHRHGVGAALINLPHRRAGGDGRAAAARRGARAELARYS